MSKRWMLALACAVMIVGTAGACDPPPPPGWVRPQVQNLVVEPAPVVPGQPFTVSATLIDDRHIAWLELWFISPNGTHDRFCEVPTFDPELDPQTVIDVEIPCEMPDFALNGTWQVVLNAHDGERGADPGQASTTFEAVGGINDQDPPVVDALTVEPASPLQGQPFTATVRVSDDHPRIPPASASLKYSGTQLRSWDCEVETAQELSPTQQEFVFTCPGVAELAAGPYHLSFAISDLNFNHMRHTVTIDIIEP